MTLGELQLWVLRSIKRPEQTQQALDAINAAIEHASTDGDFASDLVEGSLAISSGVLAQSFSISAEFARFRKIKYLKPQGYIKSLDRVVPGKETSERTDGRGFSTKLNVWYRAGDNIIFQLSNAQSVMLYSYYQAHIRYDDLDAEPSILALMPTLIHDFATSFLWADNGNAEESARLERRAIALMLKHKRDKQDG